MKILIADDNAGIREMLKLVLQSLGHEVVGEADNGEAAIKAFRELRPEVVMLDIIMPGKTGLAALDEIRALDPAAKVVMLTAVDQDDGTAPGDAGHLGQHLLLVGEGRPAELEDEDLAHVVYSAFSIT